ncbi:LLM class F420-dependent oxidoreductase [Microbacterium horticulturae]|uniref:LLM class F420-dependent oxidoreductase n=1 Tax=Microbacterium horticulturae TaxID=3028316 RepID=A0ABY8C1E4_9MICO|nr:LLM class F420-dependent oxidoreductase [Microbacterium sp. KACC 23027]WEG09172.1 LLM class F420-dependent oxidoreductase [Microbacterium sp. KACC 23027]
MSTDEREPLYIHTPRSTRRARIGVVIKPHHATYRELRAAAVAAEEAGADVLFGWDHFFPLIGDPDGPNFEAWSLLAAFAEVTHRAELGILVAANGYRNPHLHADMARTVDHISARDGRVGRVILGIGSGWSERDFEEYGYEFGTAPDRLRQLSRDLPRIKDRWQKLNPPPTRRIPILIGGGGEQVTLRITARHADIWHGSGTPDTIAHKHQILDEWCRKEGRDPADIQRSAGVNPRQPMYPERLKDYPEHAQALYDVGTRLFIVGMESTTGWDLGPIQDLIAWRDSVNDATG